MFHFLRHGHVLNWKTVDFNVFQGLASWKFQVAGWLQAPQTGAWARRLWLDSITVTNTVTFIMLKLKIVLVWNGFWQGNYSSMFECTHVFMLLISQAFGSRSDNVIHTILLFSILSNFVAESGSLRTSRFYLVHAP